MKLSVTQSGVRDAIHCRSWNDATESARHAVALVVGHDQKNIGRFFWRHHLRGPVGLGVFSVQPDLTPERLWRRWQISPVDSGCCAGRTRNSSCFLEHAPLATKPFRPEAPMSRRISAYSSQSLLPDTRVFERAFVHSKVRSLYDGLTEINLSH